MAHYQTLRLTVCEPTPAATLPVTCYAAPFPARWLRTLQRQYQAATKRDRAWLPTRSLVELLDALDGNVIHVSSRLSDEAWIYAHAPVDREVLGVAVAAWAATEVTPADPELDWGDILADDPIDWERTTLDLLACGRHANGTAKPAAHSFNLLPGYLAGLVTASGLTMLDHHRSFVLGPVDSSGRRSAVSWPPERIDDEDAGPGLWTPKIDFHVETVPGYGRPRVHADLTVTRFPLLPVTYVPRRGSRAAAVTLWLRARDGFLRGVEQPTLLGARASRRFVNGERRWAWDAGLSRALGRLTHHRYPDPQDVLAAPEAYTAAPISAYVVYSGGTRLAPPSHEDHDEDGEAPKVRSVQHAARSGFQPVDHLDD
jgi:pPIWI_RE module N-terminal domain